MNGPLIATPTVRMKDYALDRWLDAVSKMDCDFLMLDNSDDDYVDELRRKGIWAEHLDPVGKFKERFNRSWREIWKYADERGYDYILSLEADVIAPPNTPEVMMEHYVGCDFLRHSYPWRYESPFKCYGMGCTLGGIEEWWTAIESCPAVTLNTHLTDFVYKDIDILELQHLDS